MGRKSLTVFRVTAGSLQRLYFTEYHADQMARALRSHGLTVTLDTVSVPDDALTRLAVHA